jgi:hypothetical protein
MGGDHHDMPPLFITAIYQLRIGKTEHSLQSLPWIELDHCVLYDHIRKVPVKFIPHLPEFIFAQVRKSVAHVFRGNLFSVPGDPVKDEGQEVCHHV